MLLFLAVFSFVFFSHKFLIDFCENVLVYCDNIEKSLSLVELEDSDDSNHENWDLTLEKTIQLENYITDKYSTVSLYITHENIDFLYKEAVNLHQFIKGEDLSQSLSALNSIRSQTKIIRSLEKVNLQNIL